MRRISALGSVTLLVAACAAPAAPAPHAIDPGTAAVAQPAEAQPAPVLAAEWVPVYSRACFGSITPPVLSSDGKQLAFCQRLFGAQKGEVQRPLEIGTTALLAGDRLLRSDYEESWLVGPVAGKATSRGAGSQTNNVALSPSGQRFAAFEESELVIRSTETLAEISRISIGKVTPAPTLGFLSDERALVFMPTGCTTKKVKDKDGSWQRTECKSREMFVVEGDALLPFAGLGAIQAITFAAGGGRALVTREGGARTVVALPGGETVAQLPNAPELEEGETTPAALDREGHRVAVVDHGVVLFELGEPGAALGKESNVVERMRFEDAEPVSLVFSPDGSTLFVADLRRLTALREGGRQHAPRVASYEPTLPRGFERLTAHCPKDEGDDDAVGDDLCRARQLQLGSTATFEFADGGSMIAPDGHLAAFTGNKREIQVFVTATDASEYEGTDDLSWAKSIVATSVWSSAEPGAPESIRLRGTRAFEYAEFWRDGCDPKDIYVSVREKDGLLYRVQVEVPPAYNAKKLLPLLPVFFDAPFAEAAGSHAFAAPPPSPDGPC